MAKKKRECEFFHHCGNHIGDASESGLCKRCYSALYYWEDKTLTHKMKRMRNLELFHARLEFLTGVTSASQRTRREQRRRRAG